MSLSSELCKILQSLNEKVPVVSGVTFNFANCVSKRYKSGKI